MPARQSSPAQIYQLKITLQQSRPPIWRRFQVVSDITLEKLHDVIQGVMGWLDGHLHEFLIHDRRFGAPDPEWGDDEVEPEHKTRLNQVVSRAKEKFTYTYDFGDDWRHMILVEKILPPDPKTAYPICQGGARNCPPEDCGGVWGYESLLDKIGNPKHPDHNEMMEWLGDEFDPESFSADEVNSLLVRRKVKA